MSHFVSHVSRDIGNTKMSRTRSRRYVFTLNNWTEEELSHCISKFQPFKYCIGEEIGEEKTPHLQGYIDFKNQKDFSVVKALIPRAHIEKAKGSAKQNFAYCSKDGKFHTNMDFTSPREKLRIACRAEYSEVVWKDWQSEIIDILDSKPDRRTIHWYWEDVGNVGKSFLCKYIAVTREVIICDGKKDNIFNQVNTAIDAGKKPAIILLDVPRTSLEYINYGAIEALKNGLLYSGKYEGGICAFPSPHVIIFANRLPDLTAVSTDRWHICAINKSPPPPPPPSGGGTTPLRAADRSASGHGPPPATG